MKRIWQSLLLAACTLSLYDCSAASPAPDTSTSDRSTGTAGGVVLSVDTIGTIVVGEMVTFVASGGSGNYRYYVSSGGGTIDATSGNYTPSTTGTKIIGVEDSTYGYIDTYSLVVSTSDGSTSSGSLILNRDGTGTIYVGSTASFYGSGGTGSYTFSVSSGGGSIDSSTGIYTASVAGSVVVAIEDSDGDSNTYSFTVYTSAGSTDSCVSLGSSTVARSGSGDVYANMDAHSELTGYVIRGVGLRFLSQQAIGIYLKAVRLSADGTLDESDSYSFRSGNVTTSDSTMGEIYVQLPDDYILYGFGVGAESTGEDVEVIKLFGVKWNASGDPIGTIECLADRFGNAGCDSSMPIASAYSDRYFEFVGSASSALRGIGVDVTNNYVSNLWIKSAPFASSCSD